VSAKVFVSSDWHLDAVTNGVRRFDELRDAVQQTAQAAVDAGAIAYLFTGDLCDPDTGSALFRCVEVAVGIATFLAVHGIPSYWIPGNHDVIEDGFADTTLSPLRGVGEMVYVLDRPQLVFLRDTIAMVALPFTSTALTYDPAKAFDEVAGDLPEGVPVIVAAHLNVPGAVPGSETHEMPRGRDVWFPYEHIEQKLSGRERLYVQGHYHGKGQVWPKGEGVGEPINIVGSLARLTFGERMNTPSYMVIDVPV